MKGKFVLVQTASAPEPARNLEKAKALAAEACERWQPDVLVFPEMFMSLFPWGTGPDRIRAAAQPLDGPFTAEMRALAKRCGTWIVYGMSEIGEAEDPRIRNTVVVLDREGTLVAAYRKTHLYDAFGYRESELVKPGDRLFDPIDTPFGRIGLFTCYELRFPEVARDQRMKGAEILLMPTAWSAGKLKSLHFHSLIRARALENGSPAPVRGRPCSWPAPTRSACARSAPGSPPSTSAAPSCTGSDPAARKAQAPVFGRELAFFWTVFFSYCLRMGVYKSGLFMYNRLNYCM